MSAGIETRRIAGDALERVANGGAYANLVLGPMIDRASLSERDRGFVTELVYGTTRMRRALDHLIDQFLHDEVDAHVRSILRMGTYQLHFMATPPHAAVDATVGASRKRVRGLVNAVLRRVADAPTNFPSDAVRLSYPDWIFDTFVELFGSERAVEAMASMNGAAVSHVRADGYVQDLASQEVVQMVAAQPGELILDLCAAPGGKATGLAGAGANVIGGDLHLKRARLMARNAKRTDGSLASLAADARSFPIRPGVADAVLLDAPCTGLGSLRRRPDARWRIDAAAPERLGGVQTELLAAATEYVRPGGRLIYSVCTLTTAETTDVASTLDWPTVGEPVVRIPSAETDGMWSQTFLRPS